MVPRPSVTVVSDDRLFVRDLKHALGVSDLIAVSDLPETPTNRSPQLLLIDARTVLDGGHAVARMLDQWIAENSSRNCYVVRGAACPEPIERRLRCAAIHQLPHDLSTSELARQLHQHWCASWEQASVTEGEWDDDPIRLESGMAREIIARRFETRSAPLKAMLDDLAIAAEHDVTILLIGETGSGKTYLSRLIHEASPRRAEPFLHVACGALPRDLIESELFGHVRGAFTSAHADKDGKFVAAGKGTVLLDEIDVLGPEQQVTLLRVIETGAFEPVGSNHTLHLQARLIVASNLDLQPLVEQGRFRRDLYYRLNMLKFEIPPLRKRRVDIIPLARQFIRNFQAKHRTQIVRVEEGLLEALVSYPWPGNVRELENVIQRAVIYCRDGVLTPRHLPTYLAASAQQSPYDSPPEHEHAISSRSLGRQIALTEREIIQEALARNDRSKTKTAKALGISRVTLYNKLKKLDITN